MTDLLNDEDPFRTSAVEWTSDRHDTFRDDEYGSSKDEFGGHASDDEEKILNELQIWVDIWQTQEIEGSD